MLENKLDEAFNSGCLSGLHSVLIMHRGEILAERYYSGHDERWGDSLGTVLPDAQSMHDLRSVTKSITSLLYSIALAEALVPALDDSVIDLFPQYPDLANDLQRLKITVCHVLSMKMGTEWNEDLPYTDPRNSEIAMEMADDRYQFVLDRPMVTEPGDSWNYNGGATAIIALLIADGVGVSIEDYAREKLFTPLGIEHFEWIRGRDGVASAASGLRLNIHDLAKVGTLILNGGEWNGVQIVPRDWLTASLTPHANLHSGIRYGLF